jgi:hypothetical protein
MVDEEPGAVIGRGSRSLDTSRHCPSGVCPSRSHAADGAIAWSDLPDLRVHRAGVDRTFRHISVRRLLRLSTGVLRRIFGEPRFAALRAEVEGVSVALDLVAGRRRVNRHSADLINCRSGVIVMVVGVILHGMAGGRVSAGFSGNTGVLHLRLHLLRRVPSGGYIR